jgi:hypothetical protein
MVNGANQGIGHSIQITTDLFASGDTRLVNFKKYYYIGVAYGYNNYQNYNPDPDVLTGQPTPYLRGRSSGAGGEIIEITAIPHKPVPEQFGTVINSQYGDGVPVTRTEGAGNGGNALELNEETIDAIMESEPYKADDLTYVPGKGPINVKVVDPLNVRPAKFVLRFYNEELPGGGYTGDFNDARWYMIDTNNPTDTIFSETTIEVINEQIVPEYGISVSVGQYNYDISDPNATLLYFYPALLESGIQFSTGGDSWLTGVADAEGTNFFNWIRSGIIAEAQDPNSSAPCYLLPDGEIDPFVFNDYEYVDDKQIFEDVVGGILAPARVSAAYDCGPTPFTRIAQGQTLAESRDLSVVSSVDIYITQNKDRWSRCPVYEMQPDPNFAQMKVSKMDLRGALSVDKNGKNQLEEGANIDECTMNGNQALTQEDLDNLSSTELSEFLTNVTAQYPSITTVDQLIGLSFGMGWFPGFAIRPETGERLNVAFGENSYLASDNGRDMLWNPSSRIATSLGTQLVFGGQHYIYVFRNLALDNFNDDRVPMYDGGQFIYDKIQTNSNTQIRRIFRAMDWVMFPLAAPGTEYLSPEDGLVPGDARVFGHVAKPFEPYATLKDELGMASFPFTLPTENYDLSQNFWYPSYEFTTDGLEVVVDDTPVAKSALSLIDIVPNPYYAYSSYEQSRLETTVKFINLPPQCTIKIFTLNGTLVQVIEKDNPDTYIDWNLQNEFFIPISGGLYLIHVEAPDLGERVLKFFATTRPPDIKNF